LQDVTNIAEYTDAVVLHSEVALMGGSSTISLLGTDDPAAARIETLINQAIDFVSGMLVAQAAQEFAGETPMEQAMMQYIQRMGNEVPALIRPKRRGDLVQVKIEMDSGYVSASIMVGLLLPAVQAARAAARRMSSSNNLKQIGLAYHNFHAAQRVLPGDITDENGKPLLSWRVAILPYIEEQQLYEKFRLDEPWDSPHNIKLLDEMPIVYENAIVPSPLTIYQRPTGKDTMFQQGEERRFRDVLDGLSNTIMGMEVGSDSAVEWTKPADVTIDLDRPLENMGDANPQGFNVLFGDGAVIFMDNSVDSGMLRALLTPASGEIIEGRF
ncbi:MAG: DUF1559 domain-containing protein, partial [Planctomycetota bacterium]